MAVPLFIISAVVAMYGMMQSARGREPIESSATADGFKVLGKCIHHHQYRMWHHFAKSESCLHFLDLAQEFHSNDEALDDLMNDSKADQAVSMVERVFKLIQDLIVSESSFQSSCSLIQQTIVPCIRAIETPMIEMLTDRENCSPFTQLVGESFDRQHIWAIVNDATNALCGRTDTGTDYCGRRIIENLMDDSGKEFVSGKIDVISKVFYCRSTVGECCATPLLNLVQRLAAFNTRVSWIPQQYASKLRSRLRYLRWLFRYCGGKYADEDEIQSPISQVGRKMCGFSPETYYYSNVSNLTKDIDQVMSNPLAPLEMDGFELYEPQQIHLALAGKEKGSGYSDEMSVMWVTKAPVNESYVLYGSDPKGLRHRAFATYGSYTDALQNHTGRFEVENTFHYVVLLKELQPNTKYFYKIVNVATESHQFEFQTLPKTATSSFPAMAIYGDFGLYKTQDTRRLLLESAESIGLYQHLGDVGYADNEFLHDILSFKYEQFWNGFMNGIQMLASTKPYMILPGNHDVECHSPFTCLRQDTLRSNLSNFTAFNTRFRMPSLESGGQSNLWYSYNYGPIHVININTETDFPGASPKTMGGLDAGKFGSQVKWLVEDLKQATTDRELRPWIIVCGHRPIYSLSYDTTHRNGKPRGYARKLQKWLEPLFQKYKVDVYISGHKHRYERFAPIYDGKNRLSKECTKNKYVKAKATTYIVQGAGGNEELHATVSSSDRVELRNYAMALDESHYGVGFLQPMSKNHLKWEFKATTGEVLDTLHLLK